MKRKIAIFANAWSGAFIEEVYQGIREEAEKDNADIYLFLTFVSAWYKTVDNVVQLNLFKLPNLKDFDGAIILTNTFNTDDERNAAKDLVERAAKADIPILSLEVKIDGASFLGTENYKGMYDLTKHLITEHEVRDVVYMTGVEGNPEDAERHRAVEEALKEYGLSIRDVIPGDFGYYTAEESIRHWIEEGKELPDAFICANDLEAIGVSAALQNHGYEVPWDVIVTGFDKIKESKMTYPMLSTVTRDWNTVGKEAYKEIVAHIGKPDPSLVKIYQSRFIPSESCGCMPTAEEEKFRNKQVRNVYVSGTDDVLLDGFFQALRISLDQVTAKEEIYNIGGDILEGNTNFMGPDLAICTEPGLFADSDKEYLKDVRTSYSEKMDVLFQKINKQRQKQIAFESTTLIPRYKEDPDTSNVYMFVPLQFQNVVIGYAVCKNDLKMLFEKRLYRWIINMSALLMSLRRNIVHKIELDKYKELIEKTKE